jgi:hypothetical protein
MLFGRIPTVKIILSCAALVFITTPLVSYGVLWRLSGSDRSLELLYPNEYEDYESEEEPEESGRYEEHRDAT